MQALVPRSSFLNLEEEEEEEELIELLCLATKYIYSHSPLATVTNSTFANELPNTPTAAITTSNKESLAK